MTSSQNIVIRYLSSNDVESMRSLLNVFAQSVDQYETYCSAQADDKYLKKLLGKEKFIALVGSASTNKIIGGLVAYELQKFERARSEAYIYDFAVLPEYRRQGVATALIDALKR